MDSITPTGDWRQVRPSRLGRAWMLRFHSRSDGRNHGLDYSLCYSHVFAVFAPAPADFADDFDRDFPDALAVDFLEACPLVPAWPFDAAGDSHPCSHERG